MASLKDLRAERLKKTELLRAEALPPYPADPKPDYPLEEVGRLFARLKTRKKPLTVAGRVMARRNQGSLLFLDLIDGTGKLQVLLKVGEIEAESMMLFEKSIDRGDFVEFSGFLFLTKREEKTLLAKAWRPLAKALRPLPDKWHGLVDVEERYRRRYLDSLLDEDLREKFVRRAELIKTLRRALDEAGYLEVETPILQPLAGGASAKPFNTHHEALDLDLSLRISPELYLKEMLIGGFPKVYELSRCFRNEGIDATHNPEFTMLEFYEAYSRADKQKEFVEALFRNLAKQFGRNLKAEYNGETIDFKPKFKTVTYYDLFKRYALITDPDKISNKDLTLKATQFGVGETEGLSRSKLLDQIYKKVCRPKIIQPTFIVDYPLEQLPLAKRKEGEPALADAFQLVAGGLELVKAFSELNDPIEQRERFAGEEKNREAGDAEAQPMDEAYLEAMEYGMPPAGGVGIGVDRVVMLFNNLTNIRESIFFQTLRPKGK